MTLAPYQGMNLVPGMGVEQFSAEYDNAGLIYGPPHLGFFLTYAVIDGSSRDTGNTNNTSVLRPGLVMAQLTASPLKWKPFVSGASDGTQYARGILMEFGVNTQMDGADADRLVATILVVGNVNPEAVCLASTAGYGLAQSGVGLAVRKHLKYNIRMSDDFVGNLVEALSGR